jgi:4a-hydroxytetrahydrobiopterin dehydratase
MNLEDKHCAPCERDDFPAMTLPQAKDMMEHVPGWQLDEEGRRIARLFTFKNFKEAIAFTNQVGELAEEEGHHPDIALSWGKVGVELQTHSVGGLSENDFILAAKINLLQK